MEAVYVGAWVANGERGESREALPLSTGIDEFLEYVKKDAVKQTFCQPFEVKVTEVTVVLV